MDVKKIQHPPGTILKDTETGERLRILYYSGDKMFLESVTEEREIEPQWDYFHFLGSIYVKDKTAQVLYGRR